MQSDQIRAAFDTLDYGPAPEDDAPARAYLSARGGRFGHAIGGVATPHRPEDPLPTRNPATGELLAVATMGNADDVAAAVAAARAALPGWWAVGDHGRARALYALARGVQRHARLFALLETLDNGKPIRESRDVDVPLAIRHLMHHAGWAQLRGRTFPGSEPLGVCAQIVPWNFPLLMAVWKIAPALAAGNTVVLKPAEDTPLTALLLADVAREVGLPAGVLNVVTGDGATGAALVAAEVDKIAFTGSTEVGRAIRRATAGSGKRLTLELGGKSPYLVFDDADLDAAVEGLVDAIFFNQGQVCCAGSRLLVHEGIADDFLARLRRRMTTLRLGDPLDKAIDVGAVVSAVQKARIDAYVARGIAEGAACFVPDVALPERGFFVRPTLLTGVESADVVAQEEIFGPVLVAMTFRTPDEAIALANDTRYGLAASVWSENVNLALHVAPRLAAGVVWINGANHFDAAAGFGGYRESGFGREGGREGMMEYLRTLDPAPLRVERARVRDVGPPSGATDVHGVDLTTKLLIGGKQVRPDGGRSFGVEDPSGRPLGMASLAGRKDVRDAVEAARSAAPWSRATPHARAQILYYLAENLSAQRPAWVEALDRAALIGADRSGAEVDASIARLFTYAAYADKFAGGVQSVVQRMLVTALHEPWGVMGIVAPDASPLLGFVTLVAPALAMGNRVVAVASAPHALLARDLSLWVDSSDVPPGVLSILTGDPDALGCALADHDEVAAVWYDGTPEGAAEIERRSAGNLKFTWVQTRQVDLTAPDAEGEAFLRRAVQVKNVWVPYGE